MKIRAAVLEEFGRPLVVEEVDLTPPSRGEALVKVHACGVCHTDMYTWSGVDPSGYAPTVLGHEGAGVVEAVGEGVTSVVPGDHVITLFSPECGECVHCRSGKTNICTAIREQQGKGYLPDGTTRLSRGGEPLRHFMGTSTFAEYTVMPEIALARIDPAASLEAVCTLACGATTGLAAALWKAEGACRLVWLLAPFAHKCYNRCMDTTIRNLDENTYRRLKARAALAGTTIGEMVNEAIRAYLNRPDTIEKRYDWKDLRPMEFPPGNERLSEEIDRVVYGA